jgi:hypothetical protein
MVKFTDIIILLKQIDGAGKLEAIEIIAFSSLLLSSFCPIQKLVYPQIV